MSSTARTDTAAIAPYIEHHTAREIAQQPDCWLDTLSRLEHDDHDLRRWFDAQLARPGLRIILTGAGTSAYIGDCLAPLIQTETGRRVESIATTDIVGQPDAYLFAHTPTLIISFARSGNSPESQAVIDLADRRLGEQCAHLAITCNEDGALAKRLNGAAQHRVFFLPPACHDVGFAMTSSFTSMLIAAGLLFVPEAADAVKRAADHVRQRLQQPWASLDIGQGRPIHRAIFLGAGSLYGFCREAALKTLELSAGRLPSFAETPLGFRHGPKSLVDAETLIVVMRSAHPYTQRYDDDLIAELKRDNVAAHIEVLDSDGRNDWQAGLEAIVWCQMFSFLTSLRLGIAPDNPSPDGQVNRVVQGVTIHPDAG